MYSKLDIFLTFSKGFGGGGWGFEAHFVIKIPLIKKPDQTFLNKDLIEGKVHPPIDQINSVKEKRFQRFLS